MDDKEEILKKLDTLSQKAEEIRKRSKVDNGTEYESSEEPDAGQRRGARAGGEFLASVFGGGILGYGVDYYFETQPWGMILLMIMGFISGVYRANAVMQDKSDKT